MSEKIMEFLVLREPKKIVGYVCIFPDPDGKCVLSWDSEPAGTEMWDSKEKMMEVHGHGGRELVSINEVELGGS